MLTLLVQKEMQTSIELVHTELEYQTELISQILMVQQLILKDNLTTISDTQQMVTDHLSLIESFKLL